MAEPVAVNLFILRCLVRSCGQQIVAERKGFVIKELGVKKYPVISDYRIRGYRTGYFKGLFILLFFWGTQSQYGFDPRSFQKTLRVSD